MTGQQHSTQSSCPVCGAPLEERERWTFTVEDWAQKIREETGRPATAAELEWAAVTFGDWRWVWCPTHPNAVEFLAERIQ